MPVSGAAPPLPSPQLIAHFSQSWNVLTRQQASSHAWSCLGSHLVNCLRRATATPSTLIIGAFPSGSFDTPCGHLHQACAGQNTSSKTKPQIFSCSNWLKTHTAACQDYLHTPLWNGRLQLRWEESRRLKEGCKPLHTYLRVSATEFYWDPLSNKHARDQTLWPVIIRSFTRNPDLAPVDLEADVELLR